MLAQFRADRRAGRVGGTTCVRGRGGRALYFSKEVLPFGAPDAAEGALSAVLHHVGLYAYRPEALQAYRGWEPGALESAEGLEQLRFLERGAVVLAVEVEARGQPFWEVNNPEDVPRVEALLAQSGMP